MDYQKGRNHDKTYSSEKDNVTGNAINSYDLRWVPEDTAGGNLAD